MEINDVNDMYGDEESNSKIETNKSHIIAQFFTTDDQPTGTKLDLPLNITSDQLTLLINQILGNDEPYPYSFYVNDEQIINSVDEIMKKQEVSGEEMLKIVYQAEAIFRVRAVTRCTSSMQGHTDSVLSVCFSPNGEFLASGSGDKTVRLWDLETQTPRHTLSGHQGWILCLAWSPFGDKLASGAMDNEVRIWNTNGKEVSVLKGHTKWITSICWQPLHRDKRGSRKLVSGSKDGTSKIWDVVTGRLVVTLCGHAQAVTCVKWSGAGYIYTSSQDRTINMYTEEDGKLIRSFKGHAHWVNSLALSSDYILRTGPYDHATTSFNSLEEAYNAAVVRYNSHFQNKKEKLVSGSDDFTLFLWDPETSKKPISRLHGHQKLINHVCFSPDGNYFATASFDKSVKLYGADGKFITTFRAHVGAVYQIAWSPDSRMLVSASKDSTVKVWEIRTKKLLKDHPGHADEVFAIDWSPDGQTVCTGSKDRLMKLWRY